MSIYTPSLYSKTHNKHDGARTINRDSGRVVKHRSDSGPVCETAHSARSVASKGRNQAGRQINATHEVVNLVGLKS